jgi:reductive dehalogenase
MNAENQKSQNQQEIQESRNVSDPADKTLKPTVTNVRYSKAALQKSNKKTVLKAGDHGAVFVKRHAYNPENATQLGSTKIVGPIERISETETGFAKAARGIYGDQVLKSLIKLGRKHPLMSALFTMSHSIGTPDFVDGPVREDKLPLPPQDLLANHIKDLGMFLGASEVGVGLMPPHAFYSEKGPAVGHGPYNASNTTPITTTHKYAIGIIVDQSLPTVLSSTGYDGISASQSYMAYMNSGVIACSIAAYIRNLGYSARAHHCGNYQVVVPPVLVACGLGEMTRTGECVAHPRLGYRFKAAVVTTDMPMEPDNPISFGAREFCVTCKKCADECPSGAISHDDHPIIHNGYEKWNTNVQKCATFRISNKNGVMCGRCMKVCPWNNKEESWFHSLGLAAASKSQLASRLLKNIDDFFGYGTEVIEENKWWLEWPELF